MLLWEYDTASPEWDWDVMAPRVAQRVIQYGEVSDYYALLQMLSLKAIASFLNITPIYLSKLRKEITFGQ